MKLLNFYDFEPFNKIKDKMGISQQYKAKFKNHTKMTKDLEWSSIQANGLEIELQELENCEDGTLEHQNYPGQKVAVYVIDPTGNNKEQNSRYHLAWCQTLQLSAKDGKKNKFYITQTPEYFQMPNSDDQINGQKTPKVCKNCLLITNYNSYRLLSRDEKERAIDDFSMAKFIKDHEKIATVAKEKEKKKFITPFQEHVMEIDNQLSASKKKSDFREKSRLNIQNYTVLRHIKRSNYLFDENIKEVMMREFRKFTPLIGERIKYINDEIYYNAGYKDMILVEDYGRNKKFLFNQAYSNIDI